MWLAIAGVALLSSCGDSSAVGGNSSGGGGSTSSDGAAGGSGAGTTDGGSGGSVTCTALEAGAFTAERATLFVSSVTLGEDDEDWVGLYVVDGVTGTTPVSMVPSVDDCSASVPCVFVAEDVGDVDVGALFMANTGTLDLTYSAPYSISGSLSGVTLVEITVDVDGSVTVVPSGRCFDLANVSFELASPADGWACSPLAYDEPTEGLTPPECECTCGAVDPDCAESLPISDCLEGQTCEMGACAEPPTAWSCAADQYAGGPGNGCDCGCGIFDPDCDLPGEAVDNCPSNNECNIWAVCVPSDDWDCDVDYYGDESCDCGCGIFDPDCLDVTAGACDVCPDPGSCANHGFTTFGCDLSKLASETNASCQ